MKKFLLSVTLFICLFSVFITNLYAVAYNVSATARVPQNVPSEGTKLYSDTDVPFDYSAISFSTSPSSDNRIVGANNMKKVALSTGLDSSGNLDSNWFTAYCLNGLMKYPGFFADGMPDTLTATQLRDAAVMMLYKDATFYNVLSPYIDYYYYTTAGAVPSATVVNNYNSGQEVTVTLASVTFYKDTELGTVTSAQLNNAKGSTSTGEYSVTFTKADIMNDMYTTVIMPNNLYYNTALWIIEHSYPTLSLEVALKDAGADYDTLLAEIKALHPDYSNTMLAQALENYVYSTVQYAIWKAESGYTQTIGGTKYNLGDTLYGSNELNKLYKYLTKDRDIYTNYDSIVFDDKLNIVKPAEGKEIYRETDDSIVFGPYSVQSNLLSIGDAKVIVTNSDKTGINVVDVAGNKISSVRNEQTFFIRVKKNASVGSVSIKVETNNGIKFANNNNRGRLYSPTNFVEQTVASGGKAVTASSSANLDIVLNSKTGTQDILLILLIGVIAFGVGYLVLRFKGEPLKL